MILFQLELLGWMIIAMILGGIVGYEREAADKPAGLRTHMLVAGAAALLTGLAEVLVQNLSVDASLIQADPIRIMEAVITGVTFLGAGTIIRHRGENEIEGLTTAASLLVVGALGIGVAMGQLVLTVGATIVLFVTLRVLKAK